MFFSLLQLNELLGYGNEINTYLKTADQEGLQIATVVEKLNNNVEKALAVANRTKSSKFTQSIQDLDARRDESFIAFRNLMEASTHRKNDSIVSAAEQICRIIKSHNWSLYTRGYKIQSAKMASLIKELDLAENQDLIKQLNANSWYRDLVADNEAFNQLNEVRSIAENAKEDYDTQEVYKAVRIACEELFDSIEVLHRIAPNEKYETIAKFINECTQKYLTLARSRKTRSQNSSEVTEV